MLFSCLNSIGSGKTTFLKAISGQLNTSNCTLEGDITYNGHKSDSDKFFAQKVVNFVSELEVHTALLTVYETLLFAFKASTGGHHGYGKSSSPESAAFLNANMDAHMNKVS